MKIQRENKMLKRKESQMIDLIQKWFHFSSNDVHSRIFPFLLNPWSDCIGSLVLPVILLSEVLQS